MNKDKRLQDDTEIIKFSDWRRQISMDTIKRITKIS